MKAYILLEDGTVIQGMTPFPFTSVKGELVFNTAMTGYQEVMTDPSYRGQVVVMTYPLIGNYDLDDGHCESEEIQVSAFVTKEISQSLVTAYKKQEKPILYQVDTRSLTKKIRQFGSMGCLITCSEEEAMKGFNEVTEVAEAETTMDFIKQVSTKSIRNFCLSHGDIHIGILDFGCKQSIIDYLIMHGCDVTLFPYDTSPATLLEYELDGILFSNGPGNPEELSCGIETAKALIGQKPLMGICLGHQLLALAMGGETYKLPFGHHGSNHGVIHTVSEKVLISSQNHNYAVKGETLPEGTQITYLNVNDGTIEGVENKRVGIKSVQFHPEAGPGPSDGNQILKGWIKDLESGWN